MLLMMLCRRRRLVRLVAEPVFRVHREENVTLRRGPVLAIHADKVVLAMSKFFACVQSCPVRSRPRARRAKAA